MNILEARRRTLGKGVYKKTVEGNPAIAQGSLARRYPGITMQGWTEQDSTTGAQLFNSDSVVDGTISSGTVVENNNFVTSDFIPVTSGNVYSRSGTGASGNFFYDKDKVFLQNVSGTVSIKTPDNAAYVRFCIEKDAYDVNKVMFNEGSTVLPYEPYTGGQPSPNPDYPQEIVSAGNYDEASRKYEYEVKLTGANLFNLANLTGGEIVEYNGVQCYKYTDNAINFTYVDDFAENTQYCFSVMILSSDGNEEKATSIFIVYTDGTRSVIKISHNQLINVVSSANKTVAMITGNSNWSVVRYIDLTMTTLGIGTEPVPYQPYKEQTVTLTAGRPLTKWDRLEKRNGQWGWVYKSDEIVLDGSEVWRVYGSGFYISHALLETYTRTHGVCEQGNIKAYDSTDGMYGPNSIWLGVKNSNIYWNENPYFNAELEDSGIENWKNHLSQNPAVIWYETTEETFVPLSEAEQEQVNELYTFRPTTVLSNDCECEMSLTYKTKKSLEVTT